MVDPDAYNRGRNLPLEEQFAAYAKQIASLLEDLGGTEAVWDRFLEIDKWYIENTDNGAIIHKVDSKAATLTDYPFSADWINDYTAMTSDLAVDSEVRATEEIKTCFDLVGTVSSSEITQAADLVFKPSVVMMVSNAENLAKVAKELYDFTNSLDKNSSDSMPGFVEDLRKNGWSAGSLSSDSFFEFYGDLSDLTNRYSEAVFHLATTSAMASSVISRYQQEMVKIATAARDEAIAALKYWQTNQAPYSVTVTKTVHDNLVSKVADGVQTATDIAGLIPVVGKVTDPVGQVAMIVGWAAKEYDITIDSTQVREASAILSDLHEAVAKVKDEMLKALDALSARDVNAGGSFSTYVKDSQDNGGWNPPNVDI